MAEMSEMSEMASNDESTAGGLRNRRNGYGLVARLLHWLTALTVFFLFGFGLWMRSLDYYHPWYHAAPELHKSLGLTLAALVAVRLVWRLASIEPDSSHLQPWERRLARLIHIGFYAWLFALFAAGYLISTADGRPVQPFGLFSVPATLTLPHQADIAGLVHKWLAWGLMALVGLHVAGALKHYLIDRDRTLQRMWSGR
jgi:cytochrome b561